MSVYSLTCTSCGAKMVLRQTTKFTYKDGSPRKFWGCSKWPDCKQTVGAHPDGKPVGKPGSPEDKKARMAAHAVFDALWNGGPMTRFAAYGWLANQLGLTRDECHIGNFDKAMCDRVVEVCERWKKDREWKPEAAKKVKKLGTGPAPESYETEDGTLVVGEKHGPVTAYIPAPPPEQVVVKPPVTMSEEIDKAIIEELFVKAKPKGGA